MGGCEAGDLSCLTGVFVAQGPRTTTGGREAEQKAGKFIAKTDKSKICFRLVWTRRTTVTFVCIFTTTRTCRSTTCSQALHKNSSPRLLAWKRWSRSPWGGRGGSRLGDRCQRFGNKKGSHIYLYVYMYICIYIYIYIYVYLSN